MPIRDNRIQLSDAEAVAPGGFPGEWVQHDGASMISLDTATFIEGAGSIADRISNSRRGFLWQEDAARDWSNSVFYIWFNSGAANKLALKEFGGVTMRFTGPDIDDWFEVYIDGSDTYGGGFKMAVVDIDAARAIGVAGALTSPAVGGNTNNTPPATTAITRVGIIFDITSSAPGGSDNHWVDAVWRLPIGQPGIVVSGENIDVSPIRPYNWDDIVDAGDNGDPAKAWGSITKNDGVIKLNTPIQFGNAGSPDDGDHDFEDVLQTVAWESHLVPDGFYGMSFVGDGVNSQRFVMGINGSAGQGLSMLAASDGPRWFLDATDVNIENVGLYGCSLTHTTVIDVDNIFVDMFDSLLIDGQRLHHSRLASPRSGADFRRNVIIAADPIPGIGSPEVVESPENIAYCWSADLEKIIDCTWNYFTGHAIKIVEQRDTSLVGNIFDSLWAQVPASPDGNQTLDAGFLNEEGELILSISGGGNSPTTFDATSPGTKIENNINVTITGIQPGTEMRVYPVESPANLNEIAGEEAIGSPTEFSFSAAAGLLVRIVVFHIDFVLPPANEFELVIPNSDTSFPISQIIDRNYLNPA